MNRVIPPAARTQGLAHARAKFPKSTGLAFDQARVFQREGKLDEAEKTFVEAAQLSPASADVQAWTGRFFLKVRVNKPKALDYYLNAYFLNPDTYDGEYAESRIRNLNWDLAQAEVAKRNQLGVPVEELLNDANPVVVDQALQQISKNWKASYLNMALNCLGHDDEEVRWIATQLIKSHVDRSFDLTLKALLSDEDLRKRGLAAYLAVHLWKRDSFEIMKKMLTEDSELLRFDAISALILEGEEEGRRIALEHAANERGTDITDHQIGTRLWKTNCFNPVLRWSGNSGGGYTRPEEVRWNTSRTQAPVYPAIRVVD